MLKMAKKYFGDENPIGKILDIPQNDNDLLVTGICKNVPENSHMDFDLVISASTLNNFLSQPNHVTFSAYTYLLLKQGTKPVSASAKCPVSIFLKLRKASNGLSSVGSIGRGFMVT